MKVVIDGIIFSLQKTGGITRYMQELMRGTLDAGISIDVFLRKWRYGEPSEHSRLRKTFLPYSAMPLSHPFFKYALYPFERTLSSRFFHAEKPAVFHSSYYTNLPNARVPQVITVHDFIHERGLLGSSLKNSIFIRQKAHAIRKADVLISISDATSRDIAEYYQIDKKKIHTIHLGTSDIFYHKKTQDELGIFKTAKKLLRPYMLYVGNRGAYKNFNFFVSAFARWKHASDFSLAVVGGGVPTGKEIQHIRALGLESRVQWFHGVDDETLSCFYQGADAFVFPSLYEGFGLPLLEAMASGTPTIVSDIPVFREIGGNVPHYFNPRNEESFLGEMSAFYEKRKKDGGEAVAQASLFTTQQMVDKTVQLYTHMAG